MGLISLRQKQEGTAMQQTHKRSWSFTKPFSGLQALLSSSSSSSSSTGLSVYCISLDKSSTRLKTSHKTTTTTKKITSNKRTYNFFPQFCNIESEEEQQQQVVLYSATNKQF
jgi:hypothetical protein